jgi:hypothetical protein
MFTDTGSAKLSWAITDRRAIRGAMCAAGWAASVLNDDLGIRICRESIATLRHSSSVARSYPFSRWFRK